MMLMMGVCLRAMGVITLYSISGQTSHRNPSYDRCIQDASRQATFKCSPRIQAHDAHACAHLCLVQLHVPLQ